MTGAKPDTNFQMKLRLLRMSIEISRTLAKRFDQGTIVRTCFHRLSMEVVLFGGKETGVTQKIACETYLVGTISRNRRGGNVTKTMRVNGLAELARRSFPPRTSTGADCSDND